MPAPRFGHRKITGYKIQQIHLNARNGYFRTKRAQDVPQKNSCYPPSKPHPAQIPAPKTFPQDHQYISPKNKPSLHVTNPSQNLETSPSHPAQDPPLNLLPMLKQHVLHPHMRTLHQIPETLARFPLPLWTPHLMRSPHKIEGVGTVPFCSGGRFAGRRPG